MQYGEINHWHFQYVDEVQIILAQGLWIFFSSILGISPIGKSWGLCGSVVTQNSPVSKLSYVLVLTIFPVYSQLWMHPHL